MTNSNGSEKPIVPAQASAEPVVAPVAVTEDTGFKPSDDTAKSATSDSPAQGEQAEETAMALSNLEHQLAQLNAHILAMQQQLSEASAEPGAQTEEARGTLSALKAAASEVQSTIAEVKSSRRAVSAATLMQLSARIGGMISEADSASDEISADTSKSGSHKAEQAEVARKASSKSTAPKLVQRINAAIMGGSASRNGATEQADEEDEDFAPQMNRGEQRNRDGKVSPREIVGSAVGLARAATSKKKRATATRIATRMIDAAHAEDQRGILDAALAAGRGGARVTGSEDAGHAITVIVGTTATKTETAADLLWNMDVSGIVSAAGRNASAVWEAGTDIFGLNSLANDVRRHLGSLNNDTGIDFKNLINAKRVKQFDTDGNGRIDAPEVMQVLRNNGVTYNKLDDNHDGKISYSELRSELYAIAVKNNARVEGQRTPAQKAPAPSMRGKIVTLDGFGNITIESARAKLEAKGVKIDANGNGVTTYGECMAAIAQWNKTHDANGQAVKPPPRR